MPWILYFPSDLFTLTLTHSLLLYPCIFQTNPLSECLFTKGRENCCMSSPMFGVHSLVFPVCTLCMVRVGNLSGMTAKQVIYPKAYSIHKMKGWTSVICIACQMRQWWRWRDTAEWDVTPCAWQKFNSVSMKHVATIFSFRISCHKCDGGGCLWNVAKFITFYSIIKTLHYPTDAQIYNS